MKLKRFLAGIAVLFLSIVTSVVYANTLISIPVYLTDDVGVGKEIGTVQAEDTVHGLLLTPHLQDLPPGIHGFHIHQVPDCTHHAMSAMGHLDPSHSDKHLGPYSNGHLGDLPVLIVDQQGQATLPILAPRLKVAQIESHALMIHAGGDNYADVPEKLGGGGARLACGVIPSH